MGDGKASLKSKGLRLVCTGSFLLFWGKSQPYFEGLSAG